MLQLDAMQEFFTPMKVFGVPAILHYERIDRYTVPFGIHQYEVRHCDNDSCAPADIALGVWANFYATLLTKEPLPFPPDGHLEVETEQDWVVLDGDDIKLKEFVKGSPVNDLVSNAKLSTENKSPKVKSHER